MAERMATNIVWHESALTRADRWAALDAKGCTLWFTGLSASGKSTIASALELALVRQKRRAYLLDGDTRDRIMARVVHPSGNQQTGLAHVPGIQQGVSILVEHIVVDVIAGAAVAVSAVGGQGQSGRIVAVKDIPADDVVLGPDRHAA